MLKKRVDFKKLGEQIMDAKVKKLRLEANNLEAGIVNRTLKGYDKNLRPFKSYNKDYKKYRSTKGRSTKPNLTYSGNMLGAITSKRIPNGLRIYFSSKTETDKAVWNQKTRKFFGLDTKQLKYLAKRLS